MNAESYYQLTFSLMQYHKYSLTEIEDMMPWEREIYVNLLKNYLDAEKMIDEFKINLAMSLSTIINILDPDAFIFGGGVSNEIDFLHEIDSLVRKFVIGREYEVVFLKPRYGDASGVRGAARLGRSATY